MAAARLRHTATVLAGGSHGGQVLAAGGRDAAGNALASAELYNPASGTWTATGSMAAARADHTATVLDGGPHSGQVLAAGGLGSSGFLMSAELYSP
jgi:hypothetical protein